MAHPTWRTPTPDVVDSPSEHSASDFTRELEDRHRHPEPKHHDADDEELEEPPQQQHRPPLSTSQPSARDTSIRSAHSSTDKRSTRLAKGAEELAELLAASEATTRELRRALERSEAHAAAQEQRADSAESKCSQLAGLIDRERARHAANNLRSTDLESEVERLTRRINENVAEADAREAELRIAQQRLAETQGTFERVDAERASAQTNERKRAALLSDRIAVQEDELQRLETLLAAAHKARDDAIKRAKACDEECARAKREALQIQRDFDAFEARVRSGALVEATALYASQSEAHAATMRAQIAEANCERLLQLLSETSEYGRLVHEDVLGTGYVFIADQGELALDATMSSALVPRKYIASSTCASVREIVSHVNEARRHRAKSASASASGRHPPQTLAATTPLVAVEREHMYWVPRAAFDVAEQFRAKHLPSSLPLHCFHRFFIELNTVWRERMEAKIRALTSVMERQQTLDHSSVVSPRHAPSRPRSASSSAHRPSANAADHVVQDRDTSGNTTSSALLTEADVLESRWQEIVSALDRADKRAAIPRGILGLVQELTAATARSVKVYRRAALEISRLQRVIQRETDLFAPTVSAATAALNVSGSDYVHRPSALRYLDDAISAMHRNAEVLRTVADGPAKSFAAQLRVTVDDGRSGRPVSASKSLDVIERAADEIDGLLSALHDEANRVERRAGRLASSPLDAAARVAVTSNRVAAADRA